MIQPVVMTETLEVSTIEIPYFPTQFVKLHDVIETKDEGVGIPIVINTLSSLVRLSNIQSCITMSPDLFLNDK